MINLLAPLGTADLVVAIIAVVGWIYIIALKIWCNGIPERAYREWLNKRRN